MPGLSNDEDLLVPVKAVDSLDQLKLKELRRYLKKGYSTEKAMEKAGVRKKDLMKPGELRDKVKQLLQVYKEAGLNNRELRKRLVRAMIFQLALQSDRDTTKLKALELLLKEFNPQGGRVNINIGAPAALMETQVEEGGELDYDPEKGVYRLKEGEKEQDSGKAEDQ